MSKLGRVAWSDASPVPAMDELYHDVFVEPWGPYTGSSDPHDLANTAVRLCANPNGSLAHCAE